MEIDWVTVVAPVSVWEGTPIQRWFNRVRSQSAVDHGVKPVSDSTLWKNNVFVVIKILRNKQDTKRRQTCFPAYAVFCVSH